MTIESKFSQICYFVHILGYIKYEYWSLTIIKGVQNRWPVLIVDHLWKKLKVKNKKALIFLFWEKPQTSNWYLFLLGLKLNHPPLPVFLIWWSLPLSVCPVDWQAASLHHRVCDVLRGCDSEAHVPRRHRGRAFFHRPHCRLDYCSPVPHEIKQLE